jgi:hypothetical protein
MFRRILGHTQVHFWSLKLTDERFTFLPQYVSQTNYEPEDDLRSKHVAVYEKYHLV